MKLVFITKEKITCVTGKEIPADVYGYYESEKEIDNTAPVPLYFYEFGRVLLDPDQIDNLEAI